MPSSYSPNLRIELIAPGEQAGTWGTTTNTNLGTLVEDAISGYVSVAVSSANQALTALNGAADQSRNAIINLTTSTGANFAVYAPPESKQYTIKNSSAFVATIYNSTSLGNTTAAGTGVAIPAGRTVSVWSDGTNFAVQNDFLSGNASTATALQTARTIGGVSFNGTANIDLPGVNTAGTQDTSGNAATATAATTLQTARNINGTSFNGSANITTANWGASRDVTIGPTTKAVNGSANVVWSVAELGFEQSLSANGYTKLPNGLIFQWGRVSSMSGGATTTVSFSIPFPSSCVGVQTCINTGGDVNEIVQAYNVTTTTAELRNSGNVTVAVFWFAYGY